MDPIPKTYYQPQYYLNSGKLRKTSKNEPTSQEVKVVLRKNAIVIGCASFDPEAAEFILHKWKEHFGNDKREIEL